MNESLIRKTDGKFEYDGIDLLNSLKRYGIRLHWTLERLLEEGENGGRYGSAYALVSGKILRRICSPDYDISSNIEEIFQIDTETIYGDLVELATHNDFELNEGTHRNLHRLVPHHLTDIHEQLHRRIEDLPVEYETKIGMLMSKYEKGSLSWWLLYLLRQSLAIESITPMTESIIEIPALSQSDSIHFDNCKDAELYFSINISEKSRHDSGYRSTIIVDSDQNPIILQKRNKSGIRNTTGITLTTLRINNIIIPAGTLVGIRPKETDYLELKNGDSILDLAEIQGIYPLRMSIFASKDEEEAKLMFKEHYTDYCTYYKLNNKNENSSKQPVMLEDLIDFSIKLVEQVQKP